jgi:hypothetical protein
MPRSKYFEAGKLKSVAFPPHNAENSQLVSELPVLRSGCVLYCRKLFESLLLRI